MIGDAITWAMGWLAIVGIYRKNRIDTNQVSSLHESDLERRLALDREAKKCHYGGECSAASSYSSRLAFKLQMKMMKELMRVQETVNLQHREIMGRLETLEKKHI